MQSYRVGAIISAYPAWGYVYYLWREFIIGRRKDRVLPLPVSDRHNISPSLRLWAKAWDCILVGFSYPHSLKTLTISSCKPKSLNYLISSSSFSYMILPLITSEFVSPLFYSFSLLFLATTCLIGFSSSSSNRFFFLKAFWGAFWLLIIILTHHKNNYMIFITNWIRNSSKEKLINKNESVFIIFIYEYYSFFLFN